MSAYCYYAQHEHLIWVEEHLHILSFSFADGGECSAADLRLFTSEERASPCNHWAGNWLVLVSKENISTLPEVKSWFRGHADLRLASMQSYSRWFQTTVPYSRECRLPSQCASLLTLATAVKANRTDPVKNMSFYHCTTFFQLVAICYVFSF
jgi:hypothetical protein